MMTAGLAAARLDQPCVPEPFGAQTRRIRGVAARTRQRRYIRPGQGQTRGV